MNFKFYMIWYEFFALFSGPKRLAPPALGGGVRHVSVAILCVFVQAFPQAPKGSAGRSVHLHSHRPVGLKTHTRIRVSSKSVCSVAYLR